MKRTIEIILAVCLLFLLVFICRDKLNVFYYNRAIRAAENGSYAEAVKYYKKSIALEPSASAHYGLGNACLELKRNREAEFEFRLALAWRRDFFPAFEALVHLYLQENSFQQAGDVLAEAKTACPDNGKIEELSALVKFSHITGLLKKGTDAFIAGDRTLAYGLLKEAARIDPEYVFTHYLLSFLYFSERNYPLAKVMIDKALQIDVKFYPARRLLGDIYFEEGKFENAAAEYNAALACDRRDPSLLNSAALTYMNLEKNELAVPLLEEALALSPDNINMQYGLACLYRDSGRLQDSVNAYRRVIDKDMAFPNVHNDLAGVYKIMGKHDLALAEYREEISIVSEKLAISPQDPFLLADMAAAYNGAGIYYKALDHINKALRIKQDHPQAYLILADIQKNLDNPAAAQEALRKAGQFSSRQYVFMEKLRESIRGQAPLTPASGQR